MLLLFKLSLVPIFIAAIAVIGRKYGAKAAGLASGFPVIAAPILFFVYLEQGSEFAIQAARSTVTGVIALASFCFVYACSARRFNYFFSFIFSFISYFAVVLLLIEAN